MSAGNVSLKHAARPLRVLIFGALLLGTGAAFANTLPVVTTTAGTVGQNQSTALTGFFSVSDADNDPILSYQFNDQGAGGGHLELNGVPQATNTNVTVTAEQLATLRYVGAATQASETVLVRASDGLGFGAWGILTMQTSSHAGNTLPVVTTTVGSVAPNQSTALTGFFSVSDADNDPIVSYQFNDQGVGGGHLELNGVPQATNTNVTVTAEQLATLRYVGAATQASETVLVRASDGLGFGGWGILTMQTSSHAGNTLPVVTTTVGSVAPNQSTALTGFFSVSDADNDPIVSYQFNDQGVGGGHLELNGVPQATNTNVTVTAEQLATLRYVGAATQASETVLVRASDGLGFGAWGILTMQTSSHAGNTLPVVTTTVGSVAPNQSTALTGFFSVSDADNDPIVSYQFNDQGVGGGHLELNGVPQATNTNVTVTAEQLATLRYVGAATQASETVLVRASDGLGFGGWGILTMQTSSHAGNTLPVVTTTVGSVAPNQSTALTGFFSVSDADNDPIVSYQFNDQGVGGGHLELNGVPQATNTNVTVTAEQLATLRYVGAATQASETVLVRASDGLGFGAWGILTMQTTAASGPRLYFIHPDHLGTPRLVTDEQNTVVWRNLPTTEPFGNSPVEDDPGNTGNHFVMPLAFPGQYRDRESGLVDNGFRTYDVGGGRYVQSDPIGLTGGINTYTYVEGNPVSFTDPYGLFCVSPQVRDAIATGVGTGAGALASGVPIPAALAVGAVAGVVSYTAGPTAGGTVAGAIQGAAAGRSPGAALAGGIGGLIAGADGGTVGGVVGGAYDGLLAPASRIGRLSPNGWPAMAGPISRGVLGGLVSGVVTATTTGALDLANKQLGSCDCVK